MTKEKYRGLLAEIYPEFREVLDPLVKHPNYEPVKNKFRAFDYHDLDELKVVILGQDPYHTANVATGLSFNVETEYCPPSLRNIQKKIEEEFKTSVDHRSILNEDSARQGVLLLNTALTVERGKPNSHKKAWEPFTKKLIEAILSRSEGVIWILWGANALDMLSPFSELVKANNHKIIASSHPSPLSNIKKLREYPSFDKSEPFTQCNRYLEELDKEPINWTNQIELVTEGETLEQGLVRVANIINETLTEESKLKLCKTINSILLWNPGTEVTDEFLENHIRVEIAYDEFEKELEMEYEEYLKNIRISDINDI